MRKRRIWLTRVNGCGLKIPVGITQCKYLQPEACAFAWDELLEQQSSLEQDQFFINADELVRRVQTLKQAEHHVGQWSQLRKPEFPDEHHVTNTAATAISALCH